MSISAALEKRLINAKEAFRRYQTEAALKEFRALLNVGQLDGEQRVLITCFLVECHERLNQLPEAVRLLSPYEEAEMRAHLSSSAQQALCLRLAATRTESGDYPAAISYAKHALTIAETSRDPRGQGAAHLSLGKVYRIIGQMQFSRDHYLEAIRHNRMVGERVLIAQGYAGLSNIHIAEGDYALGQNYLSQALELIHEDDEPFLYGNICINLAVSSLLQEEGSVSERVKLLERAATIFRRLGNDKILARAYTNLGYQLLLMGELDRAEETLRRTIEVGTRINSQKAVANAYETLAEMYAIEGEFEKSEECIVAALDEIQGFEQFNEAQIRVTQGRMLWMKGSYDEAQTKLHAACEFNARINFSQGAFTSQLYLIEMACDLNDIAEAERLFAEIDQAEVDALNSLAVLGHLRIVTGRLALIKGQFEEAIQALQQAISIFDLNSCIYPRGLASFYLADAYRQLGRLQEAREEMDVANKHFTTMRARPMLERVEQWLANLRLETRSRDIAQTIETRSNAEALTRLIGATASRELLLHELAKVLHQDFEIPIVVIYEKDKTNLPKLLAFEGCQLSKAVRMIESWRGDVIILKPGKESPVFVALSKSVGREFNLQTALKTVEMGLELYALRRKLPIIADYERGYEENEIRLPGMVYSSAAMRDVAEQIYKIHGSKMAVLVTGESGTGKEGIARAIHLLSDRADGPFIAFNSSVVSPELIDSQLFGHRKGSFTGAGDNYMGWIRAAEGGTLFLDEIGEMPLELQPKLLRFLQESEVHPVGETKPVKVNVRVIAATNRDLESFVAEGRFREDLYYRLNVIRLHIPPLRERREEIPLLAHHLLEVYSRELNKQNLTIAPEALDAMTIYDWPGNIRQLANEIQRTAALLPDGGIIRPEQLSMAIRTSKRPSVGQADWMNQALTRGLMSVQGNNNGVPKRTLAENVEELEKQMIVETLTRLGGNIKRAADELGLTRKGLYLKLDRYGINLQVIKSGTKTSASLS